MSRVYVLCEGPTEDTFVRAMLCEHFRSFNIELIPIIIHTSAKSKGGVSTYAKIKSEVVKLCRGHRNEYVTTFLDFYGLPSDTPGSGETGTPTNPASAVQAAFQADIGERNFIANIVVHEFEALLFSAPAKFGGWFDRSVVAAITQIRDDFATPEAINNSTLTAPSKRILQICKSYEKISHGTLIALDIGLDTIRRECPLFNGWIERLEALAGGNRA